MSPKFNTASKLTENTSRVNFQASADACIREDETTKKNTAKGLQVARKRVYTAAFFLYNKVTSESIKLGHPSVRTQV